MFKKFFLNNAQKKINKVSPKVNIFLNKEMPTPCLQEVADLAKLAGQVNSYAEEVAAKPDSFFKEKTAEFKKMIAQRTAEADDNDYRRAVDEVMEEILPFYFACVREAASRTVRMRHFDVQIIGGIVLHRNKIAEMCTGEGKTLVATLAVALNALCNQGVHVVTVNDYLARRDSEWMGPIYQFLGFSVGVIQQDMDKPERRQAYGCDITYGTNNEFGFDYLRDNMVVHKEQMVQRGHFFAVVDEVDSILIDEARTPLIISGPAEVSMEKYFRADRAVRQLKVKVIIQSYDDKDGTVTLKNTDGSEVKLSNEEMNESCDAVIEEKTHNAYLTSRGESKCEQILGVKSVSDDSPDKFSNPWLHYLNQSLRAHHLFKNDREYIVKDNKVVIVDEFTGRLMPGRRWSDGLHQAVEAKENIRIQEESQTLATITLQNYFRMYKKLSGMTGTAYTEASEFRHIYKLDVVNIPTNRALVRANDTDRIYKTKKEKFTAVVKEIEQLYQQQKPVLVGTASIEDSEVLSFMLGKKGIDHLVLNAKHHEKEAYIVAQAGRLAQVTIATNMAGRGTDIILGGNLDYFIKDLLKKNKIEPNFPEYKDEYEKLFQQHKNKFIADHDRVVELGGLHVIGTQRHEARRIDNQLRGRCGRQGDPGWSRFYVSLEDDLMRLFGSERIYSLMNTFGFSDDEPIEHPWINRSLEIAQKRVEAHNFEIRKHLLEYDNVMNQQREVVYRQRRQVLEQDSMQEEILEMADDVIDKTLPEYFNEDERNLSGLVYWLKNKLDWETTAEVFQDLNLEDSVELVKKTLRENYQKKEQQAGKETLRQMEKMISLWVIDSRWKEHLLVMDSLKEGIHLRGYAQTDPLVAYQKESYEAFSEMIYSIKENITDMVFKAKISSAKQEEVGVFEQAEQTLVHSEYSSLQEAKSNQAPQQVKTVHGEKKVGRNEPCPCGSGKKYKKCCGQ